MRITKTKDKNTKQGIILVHVNPKEAMRLISSLSRQVMSESSNKGREEFVADSQEYFTIFVEFPEEDPDVGEYKRMKKWGFTDDQVREYKARAKEWKDEQEAGVNNENTN